MDLAAVQLVWLPYQEPFLHQVLHGGGDVGLGQQQAVGDAPTGVAGWAFRQEPG